MKLKDLQDAMIAAMKAKDKARKDSIQAAKDSLEFDINLEEHMDEGHAEGGESKNAESAGEKKKKKKDNGEVNFDDFVN